MTPSQISELVFKGLGPALKEIGTLKARVKELEANVSSADKSMQYRGVWQRSQSYTKGDCSTHRSSLWFCVRETTSEPGTSSDWQLTAKPK